MIFAQLKLRMVVSALLWLPLSVICSAAGCYSSRFRNGGIVPVPTKRIALHAGALSGIAFAAYSIIGLLIARFPGLSAVSGTLPPLLFSGFALFIIILIGWRTVACVVGQATCPRCHATARRFMIPLQFKPDLTLRGAFFNLRICKSCGYLTDGRNGIPEEDSRHSLPLRKAVLPFAIYTSLNLGGVLAGILAAGLFWNSVGRLALGHAEAEIAKAGFSLELPANSARPPDSENAAYWFQKAAAAPSLKEFTSPKFFEKKSQAKFLRDFFMHAQSRALTDSDLALARKLIKTHKEAVSLARKGASMRSVHWGTDWSVRSYYILPAPRDYAGLFALGQLLTCGAIVAASDGNASLSVELVRDALFLANAANSRELITDQMLSAALYQRALSGAEYVLPRVPMALAERKWGPFFKPQELLTGFRLAMQNELLGLQAWTGSLTWTGVMRAPASLLPVLLEDRVFASFYWPFLKLDLAAFYRQGLQFLETIKPASYAEAGPKLEKWAEGLRDKLWFNGAFTMLNDYKGMYRKTMLAAAQLRLAQTAMAAKRFRQAGGRWPREVRELDTGKAAESGMFKDPFSDGDLRLAPFRNGILLYSVGPDGTDDQGKLYNENGTGDIVWLCQ